ncbi:hypothetical protein MKX01_041125 [Papaver californicum]|nr:hypothetical protein MKX01_041125 [Papaver californicum]
MKTTYTSLLIITMLNLLLSNQKVSVAVTCSPVQLAPCLGAIMSSSTPPSKACCNKLREQKPCLCGYMRDPNLKQYVNTPNGKKVANTRKPLVKVNSFGSPSSKSISAKNFNPFSACPLYSKEHCPYLYPIQSGT